VATLFYKTGGNFSALTPQIVVASYLTPSLAASGDKADLSVTRYIDFTPSQPGDCEGAWLSIFLWYGATDNTKTVTVNLQEDAAGWVTRQTKTLTLAQIKGAHGGTGEQGHVYFQWPAIYAITAVPATWRLEISTNYGAANRVGINENGVLMTYGVVITATQAYAPNDNLIFAEAQTFTVDQSITFTTALLGVDTTLAWANPPAASYTLTGTNLYFGKDCVVSVGTAISPIPVAQKAIWNVTNTKVAAGWEKYNNIEFSMYGAKATGVMSKLAANAAAAQAIIVTADDMSAAWNIGDTLYILGNGTGSDGHESKVVQGIVGTTVTLTVNLTNTHYQDWFVVNWSKRTTCGIEVQSTFELRDAVVFELSGIYFSGGGSVDFRCTNIPAGQQARIQPALVEDVFLQRRTWLTFTPGGDIGAYWRGSVFQRIYLFTDVNNWSSSLQMLTGSSATWANCAYSLRMGCVLNLGLYDVTVTDVQASGRSAEVIRTFKVVSGVFTRLKIWGGTTTGINLDDITNCTFTDCTFDAAGTQAMYVRSVIATTFDNCNFGVDSANGDDFYFSTYYAQILLKDCSTITVLSDDVSDALLGSWLKADTFNDVANDHRSWWKYGKHQSVGDALPDTTRHTVGAGLFALRMEPRSSTVNHTWEFTIPTGDIQGQTMSVAVWLKINNAAYYAGVHQNPRLTVDYDDGTMIYAEAADSTAWQLLSVAFAPATTYGRLTVTLSGRTDAAGVNRYIYWDDMSVLYPAGVSVNLGGLDIWADALPVTPPIATVLSPVDVWTVAKSTLTGAGTIGQHLRSALRLPEFLALG